MLLAVIFRWCDVNVCRDPGNVSTSIIAQHDNLRVVNARVWVCDPELASRGLREITGEPLNSHSQILAPNRCEITGVDCTYTWIRGVMFIKIWFMFCHIGNIPCILVAFQKSYGNRNWANACRIASSKWPEKTESCSGTGKICCLVIPYGFR